MVTSMYGYEVSISEENYFDDKNYMYRQIRIKEDGKTKMIGVVLDETDDEFDFMRILFNNMDHFLHLPLVETLPEPLRTIVKEQEQSTYGMWFYDNDEDFPFTEDELKLLTQQIKQYGLEYIIEVNPDTGVGDPIITCYMSLCTCFNFLSQELLCQNLCDETQKFLKKKEVDLSLVDLHHPWLDMISIINSWSQKEMEESKAEFFGQLIDCIEDFLEEKGISIPSKGRDLTIAAGEDPDGLALIYGEDYDYLANQFAEILHVTR